MGTQVGLRAWPIGPTRAGWREIERQDRKVPGSRFRRHRPCSLSTPTSASLSPVSHQTQSSWGEPYFRETGPPHWAAPSRSKPPSGRLPVQSRAVPSPRPELLHGIPPGHTAATRDRTSPRVSPAPTPALYVGDVRGDAAPGRGDFTASPVPFPALEGVAAEAPPPRPAHLCLGPDAGRCRGTRQPIGTEEVGLLAAVNLPGDGSAEWERATAAAPWVLGEEPRELEEESPKSSQRTTARLGCGGQTLAPSLPPCAPDRQHDCRSAPGLLLHRAEG